MWIYKIGLSMFLMSFCADGHDPGFHEYAPAHDEYINHKTPTDYNFSYGVKDYHSGDVKHHWEKKDGDKVTGQYSLLESDGSVRTVDYTADKVHGFNAVVKHSGHHQHPLTDKDKLPSSHNEVALNHHHHHVPEPQVIPPNHRPEYAPEPQYEWKYIYPEEEGYEEALAASKLEDGYQEDASNNYYLNQGEIAQESQRSTVASQFHPIANKPGVTSKGEDKAPPQLPVDLNPLKPGDAGKIVPVDVSVVEPVEFNVKDQTKYSVKDSVVQQSHELTQEELSRFLREYYENNKANNEPQLEQGFQPIRNNMKGVAQPIPGTFDSKKKPVTTPGLSTFSSKKQPQFRLRGSSYRKLPKVKANLQRQHYRYFTPIKEDVREGRQHMSRLYRSVPNSGYVRYAKEIPRGQ